MGAKKQPITEWHSLQHTATCATGARAETRGECDCGAAMRAPMWRVRIERIIDGSPTRVAIDIIQHLDCVQAYALRRAVELALANIQTIEPEPVPWPRCPVLGCMERSFEHFNPYCERCSKNLQRLKEQSNEAG